MANALGPMNPVFYAQEALIQLEKALGMAGRVHRGYEVERGAFNKGDTITIASPSTFTATNAPATAADLNVGSVSIALDQWKEVKFKLTDKELAYTTTQIIDRHIRPAAYAIADLIDQALCAQYANIPWVFDPEPSDTNAVGSQVLHFTRTRESLATNLVPMNDPSMVHFMFSHAIESQALALSAFSQNQGAGDTGVNTQLRGTLGQKFGMEMFANQNVKLHTKGTCSVTTLAVNGTFAAGVTAINLDAVSVTGTLVAGDSFVIAGNTQRYAVTGTFTASGNAFTGVTFTPALVAAPADDAVVTVTLQTHRANLAFHRNAFALVMAPLPTIGNELGARIATVSDPQKQLAIRSRLYYVGNSSEVHVALDVLFGIKTLNPNLAYRVASETT